MYPLAYPLAGPPDGSPGARLAAVEGYRIETYGDAFAEVYDRWYAAMGDLEGCVARLATLAAGRPVVELGVGTGRVALPLSAHVPRYVGVDASRQMLARLRAKPGSERVEVVEGDMADVPVPDGLRAGLVFFSYNTFFNLASADRQRACLRRVAALLEPEGVVVLEAYVPDDDRDDDGRPRSTAPEGVLVPTRLTADTLVLTATWRDPVAQTIAGQHIELVDGRPRLHPWFIRYAFPTELDEMAAGAGLRLVHRWSGWRDKPFDRWSDHHVSVYALAR